MVYDAYFSGLEIITSNTVASKPKFSGQSQDAPPDLQGATTHKEDGGEFLRAHSNQRSRSISGSKEHLMFNNPKGRFDVRQYCLATM